MQYLVSSTSNKHLDLIIRKQKVVTWCNIFTTDVRWITVSHNEKKETGTCNKWKDLQKEREIGEDSKRRFWTAFYHGMEVCPHINCCMLSEIGGCGEAWSRTPSDKTLNDDDKSFEVILRLKKQFPIFRSWFYLVYMMPTSHGDDTYFTLQWWCLRHIMMINPWKVFCFYRNNVL